MWHFQHHLFLANNEDRTRVKCCRYNKASSKQAMEHTACQLMDIGARVEDIVYDGRYKICFVVTADCRAHVYQHSQPELKWISLTVLQLSKQCNNLSGSVVCLNSRLYWQTCTDDMSHKYSINFTEYQLQPGTEADQTMAITASPAVKLLSGFFPSDLIASGTGAVLALPRLERAKCLVIAVTAVKVVISHLLCGVIASKDHLLAPVQFSDVALSILSALKASEEKGNAMLAYLVSDRQKLIAISTTGRGWQWSPLTNTFQPLALQVPSELLDKEPVLLDDMFVWPHSSPIWYLELTTNTVHNKSVDTNWSTKESCYSSDMSCRDALLLSMDGSIVSLSMLLDLKDSKSVSRKQGLQPMQPTPKCIEAMNEKLQSILPQVTYSSRLVPQHLGQLGPISTPFTQEMANAFTEHEHNMTRLQQSMHISMSVTVEAVIQMLHTVNNDNLPQVLSSLTHSTDISKLTCLSAFNTFLMMSDSTCEMDRFRSLFTAANQKTGSAPLANLYLYLIWQLHPASIVESVLMIGCKYKECMCTGSAPTLLVDSLLDTIDQSVTKLDRNRLLLYSQLCMLSSSEDRILSAIRRLQAADIDIDTLLEKYTQSSPHRHKLIQQMLDINVEKA